MSHIPATVPIVVGAVLGAMIVVVVVAYFVGKSRNSGIEPAPQVSNFDKCMIKLITIYLNTICKCTISIIRNTNKAIGKQL